MGWRKRTSSLHVVVVGAGYAGVLTANRLAHLGHRVTVVNDRPTFVDRIRLHEVVAGTRPSAERPLDTALTSSVRIVLGRAVSIQSGDRPRVLLTDGRTLTGDHVVLAYGSGAAGGIGSPSDAAGLRRSVAGLGEGATVRVDGAGATGVELATEIATAHPHLRVLLHDPAGVLPFTLARHRLWLARRLARLGVVVCTTPQEAELIIDCTGLRVPDLGRTSGLPSSPSGRLLLDECLRVAGHQNLWGVGDAAVQPGRPLRMSCAAAEPMGAHVADAIHADARGRLMPTFSLGFAFQCVSLGRRDGLIIFVRRNDAPTRWRLTGRAAAAFKAVVCWFAATVPTRLAPWYAWPRAGRGTTEPPASR